MASAQDPFYIVKDEIQESVSSSPRRSFVHLLARSLDPFTGLSMPYKAAGSLVSWRVNANLGR